MSKNKSKSKHSFRNSPFYFDDCVICQAMAKAEKTGRSLSEKELRQAFADAEKSSQSNSSNNKYANS